jgi:enoyl-CoA hydratase/carnithine racemase
MEVLMSTVLTTVADGIGTITLNHGKVNALSRQLIEEITSALDEMQPPDVRVVIIRALKGPRFFPQDTMFGNFRLMVAIRLLTMTRCVRW